MGLGLAVAAVEVLRYHLILHSKPNYVRSSTDGIFLLPESLLPLKQQREQTHLASHRGPLELLENEVTSIVEEPMELSQVAVIIPTCNAEKDWPQLVKGLRQQGFPAAQILIIDSASEDRTADLAVAEGYKLLGNRSPQLQPRRYATTCYAIAPMGEDSYLSDSRCCAGGLKSSEMLIVCV